MKVSRILLLLLCLTGSPGTAIIFAQSPEHTYSFALEQMKEGNYDQAVKLLKRVRYFDLENQFPLTFSLLAECFYQKSDFTNAYYYYDLALIQSGSDSLSVCYSIRKAECKLFTHDYHEALIELFSANPRGDRDQTDAVNTLFGITYFYLKDLEKSKDYFIKSVDKNNDYIDSIHFYFKKIEQIGNRYNPATARLLSLFLPGSGQIYSGEVKEGINSLFLTTGLLFTGIALSGSISAIDATIIILPWFQRYYSGGYQKAFKLAGEKQARRMNEQLVALIKMIDSNQNSTK